MVQACGHLHPRTCTIAVAAPVWLAASVAVRLAVQLTPVELKTLTSADALNPVVAAKFTPAPVEETAAPDLSVQFSAQAYVHGVTPHTVPLLDSATGLPAVTASLPAMAGAGGGLALICAKARLAKRWGFLRL